MNFFCRLTLLLIVFSTSAFAEISPTMLEKTIEEKQERAIKLINAIGVMANSKQSSDADKADAEYAYNGFIARFQGIKEDREVFERKAHLEVSSPRVENYSERLDRLLLDLHTFLR